MVAELRQRPQVTRVLVALPHALVRQGLIRVLEGLPDVEVVAHTGDTDEALQLAQDFEVDLVVIDADLGGDGGIELAAQVKAVIDGAAVLVLADRPAWAQVERALGAGIDGFTVKDVTVSEFTDTVRRIAAGEVVLHPTAASVLAQGIVNSRGGRSPLPLTSRQREILRLLALGLENKQIARRLDIGVHTVKTHVSRILTKLGASSRTEAVVTAMRERLIG